MLEFLGISLFVLTIGYYMTCIEDWKNDKDVKELQKILNDKKPIPKIKTIPKLKLRPIQEDLAEAGKIKKKA